MIVYIVSYLLIFSLGASIGSFLNVVIYRLPNKISLIYPPSRCPKCFHPLGKTENIPLFGWLWLKGCCRWCKTSISFRYPLIETITGILFVLVTIQFGFTLLSIGYCIFLSWLLALALIDFDTMILPNSLTQSGLIIGLIFQSYLGYTQNNFAGLINFLFASILSMVMAIWLYDFILIFGSFVFGKPAMGGGDPKLAAMIAVWLVGWQNILITIFLASLIGAIIGISLKIINSLGKKDFNGYIPFGPFLALATFVNLFYGKFLLNWYSELIGF